MLLILFNIKEKNKIFFSRPAGRITILALDCEKYRGDLDVLSSHTGIRLLFIKQNPLGWLIKPFYSELDLVRYINAKKNSKDAISHKKAFNFMRQFLLVFYKHVSVDCVTTVNYRYPEDYNWAKASDSLGVPFIMLYRECLLASNRLYDRVVLRKKQEFGKFHGSHIIVHNDVCKQAFIDSGYISSNKISVAGALRMDSFIKNNKNNKENKIKKQYSNKNIFILFYFPHNHDLFGEQNSNVKLRLPDKYKYHDKVWGGRDKLFIDLHNTVIELAVEHPNIEFIIKPKQVMVDNKSWDFYKDVIRKSDVNVENLSNYKVDINLDVSKNIISSSVVCALQSSVVLESAFAGKRVILPVFYNFLNAPHSNDFFWKDDLELFDIVTNKTTFKKKFKDILDNPDVPKSIQCKRMRLFKKWFNSASGNSLDEYYNIIKNVVQ